MHSSEHVDQDAQILLAKLRMNPSNFSEYNELLSLFFGGFSLKNLSELLQHSEERVIAGGLFIAEELGAKAAGILDEVIVHVTHKSPRIRISAYQALTSCITVSHQNAFIHVVRGMRDLDLSCRKISMLLTMRVPDSWLQATMQSIENACTDQDLLNGLRLILGPCGRNPATIRAWILDEELMIAKFGMIAAGRVTDMHPDLLDFAAQNKDPDIKVTANAQLHFVKLRRKNLKN